MRSLAMGVVLFAAWLLLSGHYSLEMPLVMAFGVASCVFVVLLARRMRIADEEGLPLHVLPRFAVYFPWLIWQIVVANFDVARRVLGSRAALEPVVVTWNVHQKTDLGRVILANSITLTPGTFTIQAEGGKFVVHAIHWKTGEIEEGKMDRLVRWVEGES